MEGILLIDKPIGWTSFDAVNKVRRIVAESQGKRPKSIKVGHTGTLDPLASGLLVVLVGKEYTRMAQGLSKQDKTYSVEMCLGQKSSTGDNEGEKTVVDNREPSVEEVLRVCEKFVGHHMQKPPAYSALKVNGQRAYELARAGKEVDLPARPVTVYSLSGVAYDYPTIRFDCVVSSGTYIRSLVEDIGDALGVGAYMSGLRRVVVGRFEVSDAISSELLSPEVIQAHIVRPDNIFAETGATVV